MFPRELERDVVFARLDDGAEYVPYEARCRAIPIALEHSAGVPASSSMQTRECVLARRWRWVRAKADPHQQTDHGCVSRRQAGHRAVAPLRRAVHACRGRRWGNAHQSPFPALSCKYLAYATPRANEPHGWNAVANRAAELVMVDFHNQCSVNMDGWAHHVPSVAHVLVGLRNPYSGRSRQLRPVPSPPTVGHAALPQSAIRIGRYTLEPLSCSLCRF